MLEKVSLPAPLLDKIVQILEELPSRVTRVVLNDIEIEIKTQVAAKEKETPA